MVGRHGRRIGYDGAVKWTPPIPRPWHVAFKGPRSPVGALEALGGMTPSRCAGMALVVAAGAAVDVGGGGPLLWEDLRTPDAL